MSKSQRALEIWCQNRAAEDRERLQKCLHKRLEFKASWDSRECYAAKLAEMGYGPAEIVMRTGISLADADILTNRAPDEKPKPRETVPVPWLHRSKAS